MTDALAKTDSQTALPHTEAQSPMVSMIERIATDPNAPIEKLERMLAMQERIMATEAKAEHAAARATAMAEMPTIPKRGKGHNGKPYALLSDIVSITRPVLAKHGLVLTWDTEIRDATIIVTAKLAHRNGHEEKVSLPLPFDSSGSKSAVQAIGSSQTYGQRYTGQAVLGLALGEDMDDDGQDKRGATITEDQFRKIRDLCERAKVSEDLVCKAAGVETLFDLPAAQFESVKKKLMLTVQKVEGE